MKHALRLVSRGQRRQLPMATTAVAFSTAPTTMASSCSDLRTPLPGAYREPTELWHSNNAAEGPSEVEVGVVFSVHSLFVLLLRVLWL